MAFTGVLLREGVAIGMDGRGRTLDNIFVERPVAQRQARNLYLAGYATMGDLTVGLTRYFAFDNGQRPHQSLGYQTADVMYASGEGGGAMIVDKYGSASVTAVVTSFGAAGHGAPPHTPPCREQAEINSAVAGVGNQSSQDSAVPL